MTFKGSNDEILIDHLKPYNFCMKYFSQKCLFFKYLKDPGLFLSCIGTYMYVCT